MTIGNFDTRVIAYTKIGLDSEKKDDYKILRKNGPVEGRYPALYVSYKIDEAVGNKAGYVRNQK